ncbi:ABC transporter ATP-binding protein [Halalkalibacter nanhaiisediminis]|uniref:Oligopeptide transport system ATP-binding protein n=1 Tax=Halalkalibacter nanhaiisediminis TaxID=688079 RepID=A0A562QBL8_9BACI|nr:ABC transporter ATP-binding protein [Halalkalibacter nanhaiisediminis]TWI54103.1 oligopeptide transport system ATP-binding protein [Halalkalibacter nanhaiisediminis]
MADSKNNNQQSVLEIKQLSIQNSQTQKVLINGLDLTIRAGEMVGLVEESGSGKSITASTIMGLLPKQLEISQGEVIFQGHRIDYDSKKQLRRLRGKEMAMVFQDYNGSLTPFVKIGKQMVEVIRIHKDVSKKEAKQMALWALRRVKLPEERVFTSYPFELSGGQKQRVAIAIAMIHKPALLIADEPSTALDAVTGEHILELIDELRQESNCAVLYITHHLGEVLNRASRIAVMYGGHIVEEAVSKAIGAQPQHPFTDLLLKARPSFMSRQERLAVIPGDPGNVAETGCPFVHRCPKRNDKCLHERSEHIFLNDHHRVACHLYSEHENANYYDEVLST